jgi:hypothetical protein
MVQRIHLTLQTIHKCIELNVFHVRCGLEGRARFAANAPLFANKNAWCFSTTQLQAPERF